MSEHFPKLKYLGTNVKNIWDLPNYLTKADLKKLAGIDTSHFVTKNSCRLFTIWWNEKCSILSKYFKQSKVE